MYTYFESKGKPTNLLADEQLAQEFLQAQDRAEEAKVKVSEADRLVQELAEAQKIAQNAQEKALEAKQKIEAEVRRRVETEMENKLAAEQQARQKAEAEHLAQEAEARQKAEDRANYLAQAALEAQQLAEAERKKAEKEAHQRELEESVRRRAEVAATQLAEQVADAKKKYEEAKQQAEREAELRLAADDKRQKIESELQAFAESETERRKAAEGEAQKQIQAQASRYEKEAIAAQQRVEEARRLAELEVQKREQAEAAKQLAEEEARRLAKEMLEVQKHIKEIKLHTTKDTQDRSSNSSGSDRSEHSASDSSSDYQNNRLFIGNHEGQRASTETSGGGQSDSNPRNQTPPFFQADFSAKSETSKIQTPIQSSDNFVGLLDTNSISKRKVSIPIIIVGLSALFFAVVVGGYGIYYFATPNPDVNENIDRPANQPVAPTPEIKKEMILIQGGKFSMGRSDVVPDDLYWGDQYPAHPVPVNSFYIDKTETSNEDYAKFVQEKNYPPPQNWTNGKPPAGQEKYPVTSVSMSDANAYAEWFSESKNKICRLPTEEEWEFAARNGEQQTAFPWGNKWNASLANIPPKKVAEVGNSSDETLVGGIKDMMGNVLELTSSKYVLYPGHPGEFDKKLQLFVVRGSSSAETSDRLKKAEWLLTSRQSVTADNASPYMGFRLVCQP
ncbi:MAG: SUMF1/EgtB/PvdO family nonheme iron enzyme [Acidobacteria bacterium]|nr:SUMF1/EgtB/PvdO family nonheme iron enzyme [Acidobacteriota bacterium]